MQTFRANIRWRNVLAFLLISLIGGLVWPACASAQEYPSRAVRMIVPSSAGSGVDIVARIVARRMTDALGAQVVIDNRAGAAGVIGVQLAAKSAPDGYTVLTTGPSFTINASLSRKLPYDPVKDFAPIGQATTGQ
jgi:tripartite-type tricarboxylate transporter receptor subunit TctC